MKKDVLFKKERDGCVFLLFQRGQKGSMVVDLYACNTGMASAHKKKIF